ncbi:MAG: hypothetical protein NZ605_11975, partial [Acidimicrobiales bacterium]|nr:hypothetical protein [Acidimicrobiales bacterium]
FALQRALVDNKGKLQWLSELIENHGKKGMGHTVEVDFYGESDKGWYCLKTFGDMVQSWRGRLFLDDFADHYGQTIDQVAISEWLNLQQFALTPNAFARSAWKDQHAIADFHETLTALLPTELIWQYTTVAQNWFWLAGVWRYDPCCRLRLKNGRLGCDNKRHRLDTDVNVENWFCGPKCAWKSIFTGVYAKTLINKQGKPTFPPNHLHPALAASEPFAQPTAPNPNTQPAPKLKARPDQDKPPDTTSGGGGAGSSGGGAPPPNDTEMTDVKDQTQKQLAGPLQAKFDAAKRTYDALWSSQYDTISSTAKQEVKTEETEEDDILSPINRVNRTINAMQSKLDQARERASDQKSFATFFAAVDAEPTSTLALQLESALYKFYGQDFESNAQPLYEHIAQLRSDHKASDQTDASVLWQQAMWLLWLEWAMSTFSVTTATTADTTQSQTTQEQEAEYIEHMVYARTVEAFARLFTEGITNNTGDKMRLPLNELQDYGIVHAFIDENKRGKKSKKEYHGEKIYFDFRQSNPNVGKLLEAMNMTYISAIDIQLRQEIAGTRFAPLDDDAMNATARLSLA